MKRLCGDARGRRSRGRGAVWALRRPPALGEAGDEEMSQAMQQTKLDNATLELHDKHNNDAHKETR